MIIEDDVLSDAELAELEEITTPEVEEVPQNARKASKNHQGK